MRFLTDEQREKLIEEYIYLDVDSWDIDTLYEFALDKCEERLKEMSDDDIIDEVAEYFPELAQEYEELRRDTK